MLNKIKNFVKENYISFLIAIMCFTVGFLCCKHFNKQEVITIEKPVIVKGETETVTKTEIAYIPKETIIKQYVNSSTGEITEEVVTEKTDLDANIGKTEFDVKLNGKDVTFKKDDNEKFVFDKNKVALEQTSTVTFNATVSPYVIDKTKRWSVGIGKSNHNGTAYTIDFPIGSTNTFAGWAYKDDDSETIGIKIKF